MDLYGHGLGYRGRPVMNLASPGLGLEEGQVNLTCGPGTTKVYLQEFPWEKCVPDSELEVPAPQEVPEGEEPIEAAPQPEPAYQPPGKARFLEIDPASGQVVDPDTGATIRPQSVFLLAPAETVGAAIGVLAVTGILLLGLGVFGKGGK
jgi:hypothetical protein